MTIVEQCSLNVIEHCHSIVVMQPIICRIKTAPSSASAWARAAVSTTRHVDPQSGCMTWRLAVRLQYWATSYCRFRAATFCQFRASWRWRCWRRASCRSWQSAKFIILNAQLLVFNAKFITCIRNLLVFTHGAVGAGRAGGRLAVGHARIKRDVTAGGCVADRIHLVRPDGKLLRLAGVPTPGNMYA